MGRPLIHDFDGGYCSVCGETLEWYLTNTSHNQAVADMLAMKDREETK